jgi:dihydroxy-acid dehydratase
MVKEDLRPSKIITRKALENAIATLMALGGSTNAVIHLTAIAGRLNIDLPLEVFDEISRRTPYLANVKPSGKHMMEAFFYAGGLPALMREIRDLLHADALTVTGKTMAENLERAVTHNADVIRPRSNPLLTEGGLAILRGNLAPGGAVIKQSAAAPHLMKHTGRAMVFESREDLLARIDDPNLDVDANSVLVLKGGGPVGAPGMPEWCQLPIPTKLLNAGVTDMVRISDARMSGTSYGTVVLHVTPEAAVGGPLAAVRSGDMIELDVAARKLHLRISDAEFAKRMAGWKAAAQQYVRGYGKLFLDHILQADKGCDFDFLRGIPGRDTTVQADDVGAHYALMGHS